MKSLYNSQNRNKKGLSAVVTVMILILMIVAATSVIWVVVQKSVKNDLGKTKSCYEALGKITLNSEYTCYDDAENKVLISVNIGDAEIDELMVAIRYAEDSKVFTLTNEEGTIEGLTNYPDGSSNIVLPGKKAGKTYVASNIMEEPTRIEIAYTIDGDTCEDSDYISEVPSCTSLSL